MQLREMLATAPVKVRLRANVENIWRPVQITTGEIKAPVSDDFVVVGGHQDSWPGPADSFRTMIRFASGYGSGRSRTALTMLKIAVFAPIPSARVRIETAAKAGFLVS